jgi:hypothetical protein
MRFPHLLTALLMTSLSTACTSPYTVPLKLVKLNESTEIIGSKSVGPPTLRITTHSDGLGWTVQPEQRVQRTLRVTQEETWEGQRYTRKNIHWYGYPFIAAFDVALLCPLGIIHALTQAYRVTEPTYATTWEGCLLGPSGFDTLKPESGIAITHTPSSDHRTILETQLMTAGRVSLLWLRPGQDPIGLEEVIPQTPKPVVFRLRWLADVLQRHGWSEASETRGQLIFRITHTPESPTDIPLSMTAEGIQSALSQTAVRGPSGRWPSLIRVRVVTQDQGIQSNRSSALEDQLITYLTRHNIPVVLRGPQRGHAETLQIRQMNPAYRDGQHVGQWAGATLLIVATHDTPAPDSSLVTVTAANIETGEIVGSFHVEGRSAQWNILVETIGARLLELLPQTLDNQGSQRKEGVIISQ